MSKYDQLPPSEKDLADRITHWANVLRNAINASDMTPERKWEEILALHEQVKEQLCAILIRN